MTSHGELKRLSIQLTQTPKRLGGFTPARRTHNSFVSPYNQEAGFNRQCYFYFLNSRWFSHNLAGSKPAAAVQCFRTSELGIT